ncbi:MAG TPA: transposase [Myxococcota bacterium]|nr:transposase [Myxococcota bacterium]
MECTTKSSAAGTCDVTRVVLQRHLATFLERAEAAGGLPGFVIDELRDYVGCGSVANGFARVRCDDCGRDHLVGFSCGGRGFCPRCNGRRMNDTAAYLADQVLVDVPVRQWVLTVPWWLRARLLHDNKLTSEVLRIFLRTVHAWLRERCNGRGQPGAVTVIQRFGSALRAHLHFHSLVPHGTYIERPDGSTAFLAAPVPTHAEVVALTTRVAERVATMLERRGLLEYADVGPLEDEVALRACAAASANQVQLLGPNPGQPTERQRNPFHTPGDACHRPLVAQAAGFTLHADVAIRPTDPGGLERLCRYVARPAIASKRLRLLAGDRVAIDLRHEWRDGTTTVVLEPLDFIARLAALIPPPRCNLVRHHGVFAPAARLHRKLVRPAPPLIASARGHTRPDPRAPLRRRLLWAELMQRTYGTDVLECPACGGRRRLIALIDDPLVIRAILTHLRLPTSPPQLEPARGPPEPELDFAA